MTSIEFYNETADSLLLWIELACIEIELNRQHEYRIEAEETAFRMEFRDARIVLYLENTFGPKVLQRPYRTDLQRRAEWELVVDYSDI